MSERENLRWDGRYRVLEQTTRGGDVSYAIQRRGWGVWDYLWAERRREGEPKGWGYTSADEAATALDAMFSERKASKLRVIASEKVVLPAPQQSTGGAA